MSNELSKMTLIAIVQQLPEEDIKYVETYIKNLEQENNQLKLSQCKGEFSCFRNKVSLSEYSKVVSDYKKIYIVLSELEDWLKGYSSMLTIMPNLIEQAQLDLIEEILYKIKELKGSDNNE